MTRRRLPTSLLTGAAWLLAALATALPAPARGDDWTSLGLGATRGRASAERSGTRFDAAWSVSLPPVEDQVYRALLASPAVADGVVVYASAAHGVRALREHDGALLWQVQTEDAVYGSPAIDRGRVFVASLDRSVRALALNDGALVWRRDLGGLLYGSPTVSDGALYVAVGNPRPRLVRLDAETGSVAWESSDSTIVQAAHASPAVGGGYVLAGEMDGGLHAFDVRDGRHVWTYRADGLLNMSSPLIVDGRVYLLPGGDDRLRLHAVDLVSGLAVPGWPVEVALPGPRLGNARLLKTVYVPSSPAGNGELMVLDARAEDRLDQNGDGSADRFVLREYLVAVDPGSGRTLWARDNGRLDTTDLNGIPSQGLCPTPALFRGPRGESLIAAASTLAARLRVLHPARGIERWSKALSGPTRGSPLLANGRLMVATDAGVLHALLSTTNEPPAPPLGGFWPRDGQPAEASSPTLRWAAARDPEGGALTYQVRYDSDGEVLHTWSEELVTSPGATSIRVAQTLTANALYTWAVRSRDSGGAWSAWSEPQTFVATPTPAVSSGGVSYRDLAAALRALSPGQPIQLGVGTFALTSTLRLPDGASLTGAAPHQTVIDGTGLDVAIAIESCSPDRPTEIARVTVMGAATGIAVSGCKDAVARNVILRDLPTVAIDVGASGAMRVVNATITRSGIAVRAFGPTELRNSIVTENETGLAAGHPSLLASRFNDVFANRVGDYRTARRGDGDLSVAVQFDPATPGAYLLRGEQPTTDRGDPADPFTLEPAPNGGRVNLGAHGNTALAEPSPTPPPDIPIIRPDANGATTATGCAVAGRGPGRDALVWSALAALALTLLVSRRTQRPSAPGRPRARSAGTPR